MGRPILEVAEPRTGVAQGQRRPREPRLEGNGGDRELPHGGPRRACRALRRLRTHGKSSPMVIAAAIGIARSARARQARVMAGRARGRAAAHPILPCGLHVAGGDRRHRLPEQGHDLRPYVQGLRRDDDHDRGRSQTPVTETRLPGNGDQVPAHMTIIQGDELRTRGVSDLRTALSLTAPAWKAPPGGDTGPAGAQKTDAGQACGSRCRRHRRRLAVG